MLKEQMWMRFAPELLTQWRQCYEEGRDVEKYRENCCRIVELSKTEDCEEEAKILADKMAAAPQREDYYYIEPSDYEKIQLYTQPQPAQNWRACLTEAELREKIAGAWIGRISGCLLGKPMECLKSNVIGTILRDTGNWPMNRYVDSREFPEGLAEKVDMDHFAPWQKCWVDRIGGKAPLDDDTNYTVLALKLIEEWGKDFTPDDVLEAWLYSMPMFSACTAERVAYRNAAAGLLAPETAIRCNPYREWIGAQIRGDFFGYIHPGDPHKAAEMAWRDASISHRANGIYGEMYVAAMIAQAAVCDEPRRIVDRGLCEIPEHSRLAEEIRRVLLWYDQGVQPQEAFDRIHEKYDEYLQHDWCHTIPNAMIVTVSFLYSDRDFGRAIGMAVQTGFDTDCNAATAGSILGMLIGERGIPARWPAAYNRTLRTGIEGYHEVTVEQLCEKTMELMKREW